MTDQIAKVSKFIPFFLVPLFQVVTFPNDACTGSSKNGTCYTKAECSNRGGTQDGTCANGYGVCCIGKLCLY